MNKIVAPKIKSTSPSSFEESILEDDFNYKTFSINPQKALKISFKIISGCIFNQIDFSQIEVENVEFADCIFNKCIFINNNFSKLLFQRVQFNDCKLLGCDFSYAKLKDIRINAVVSRYLNFYNTNLERGAFISSKIEEGYFEHFEAKNLVIEDCNFEKTSFFKSCLTGCDFSSSEINNIRIDFDSLKGIIVNSSQAVSISKLLGIIVKEG